MTPASSKRLLSATLAVVLVVVTAFTPAQAAAPKATAQSGNCLNNATKTTYNAAQNPTGTSSTTNSDPCTFSGTPTPQTDYNFNITHSTVDGLPWCPKSYEFNAHADCVSGLEMHSSETFYVNGAPDTLTDGNIECSNGFGDGVYDYATFNLGATTFSCSGGITIGSDNGNLPTWVEVDLNEIVAVATTAGGNADGNFSVYTRYLAPISAGPAAGFTITPPSATNANYAFTSTSSTGGGDPITSYNWSANDGATDPTTTSATWLHNFTTAGQHTVTLTVADSIGRTASITQNVDASDLLTDAIAVTAPDGSPLTGASSTVGKQLLATVTVTSPSTNSDTVTGLAADPALTVTPPSALTLVSGPSPTSIDGTSLTPGQSFTYSDLFTITGVGAVTLSAAVTGTAAGTPVSGSATKTIHLAQPLKVDVAWQRTDGTPLVLSTSGQPDQPNTIRLADNDDGEIPADIVAVVTLTNASPETQTAVTVNGIPALSYHNPADALQALPIGVTVGPLPSGTPADMLPGDVRQVTYRLHVTNNGVFDFSPQVLSSDANDLNSVSQGVGTITALPTALLWLTVKQRDTRSIRAGDTRYLTGRVTNRSLTQSVDVVPIEPAEVDGNGGGGGLSDDTKAPLADGTVPPFSGILKPGQTVDLSGELDTAPIPATRAVLTYQPAGAVVNADATETDLTGNQVGMSAGSSPINVQIQDTDPDTPPITVEAAFNSFTDGAVQGAGSWAAGHLQAAATLLAHPVNAATSAISGVAKLVVTGPRALASAAYIDGMTELYGTVYLVLTPAERQAFEKQILDDYDQSYLKADNAEALKAVDQGFASFADAMQTGDFRTVANLAGHGLSTGGGVVADAVLSDVFFQQLGIGLKGLAKGAARGRLANALVLADEALQKKLPAAAYREITAVKAGQNLLLKGGEALENVFGLTKDQIAGLQKFCQENKIIVAVRARSKRAADLIRRGLAVGKNEVLKLKGVNEIDVDYLGYAKADLNTLVFAEPVPEGEVIAELNRRGVTGNQREVVLDRYKQRQAEWTDPKVAGVMDKANAKGEIEWGFNGTDNGAKGADRSAQRRFALHDKRGATMLDGKTARKYQTVYVSNVEGTVGGRLVRVTQDTDMLAILSENGEILSAALRTKAYEYLSDVLGIEHPETVSWLKGGDILFLAKIKELLRTAKGGGEALGVFGPDGSVRAGFLNPALTVYDVAEKTGVIFFEGGYNNPYAKAATKLLVTLKRFGG